MKRTSSPAFLVVIPAYQPDSHLVDLVKELSTNPIIGLIVVNDGSGENYQSIFDALSEYDVILLQHDVNQGKGSALKTGLRYAIDHFPRSLGVVTADADGQHAVSDIIACGNALLKSPQSLIIGTRNFSEPHVPIRSRLGNRITAMVHWYLTDEFIQDTQTGLRAFPKSLIPNALAVTGDRFEYEMNVLLEFVHQQITMVQIPIQTIYRDKNSHSHFNSLKDSRRIYGQIADSLRPLAKLKIATSITELLVFLLIGWFWTTLPNYGWFVVMPLIRLLSLGLMMALPFTHYQAKWKESTLFQSYLVLRLVSAIVTSGFVVITTLWVDDAWALIPIYSLVVFYSSYRLWSSYFNRLQQVKK